MVLTSLRVLPQTLLRNALCGYHIYLTTVVFDKYYMHFANENQPVFFHKITAQLLLFLRLFDGMVLLTRRGERKMP